MGEPEFGHAIRSPGPLDVFRGEQRLAVIVLLLAVMAIAGIAWLLTLATGASMTSSMMASMVASGDLWMLGFFLLVWGVMMVAMMFPAAAPMVQAYAQLSDHEDASRGRRAVLTGTFLGVYAGIWAATGLAAAGGYLLLGRYLAGFSASGTFPPVVVGVVFIAAGVYQATPLKDACLKGCRTPVSFLLCYWRPGVRGALGLGARHAAFCVGCCWMLFAVLFVVGVMAVGWMALLAGVIFFEKLFVGRTGVLISLGIGGTLAAVGAALLLIPAWSPGILAL